MSCSCLWAAERKQGERYIEDASKSTKLTLVLGLLLVNEVKALRLELAVDEGTGKAGKELLRLSVARGLAVRSNVLLVGLGSLRTRTSESSDLQRRS